MSTYQTNNPLTNPLVRFLFLTLMMPGLLKTNPGLTAPSYTSVQMALPSQANHPGASLIYIEDQIKNYELWATKGLYGKLKESDNFIAEMSAINKALRSIPINIHATIWTNSLSCIQAINKTLTRSSNIIRTNARPYLRQSSASSN